MVIVITAVDERNIILIKALEKEDDVETIEKTADMIVDMMNSEAMMNVRVAYGTVVGELREVSKSYIQHDQAIKRDGLRIKDRAVLLSNHQSFCCWHRWTLLFL